MVVETIPVAPTSGKRNALNPLSKGTRKHIGDALKEAIANPNVTSIILYGGKNFSAGADIEYVQTHRYIVTITYDFLVISFMS